MQAVDRAVAVIRLLSDEARATLKVVCAGTGLPASTAYRILETLRSHKIVDFDEQEQTWGIGVETFRMGQSYVRRRSFMDVGRRVMHELTDATGESSSIAVFDNWTLIHVSQVESKSPIRAFIPPGTRTYLHASGIGKAVLAYMDPLLIRKHLGEKGLPSYTATTIVTIDSLLEDLQRTRQRGWAFDNEERYLGVRCIAAPIFNQFGEALAGISISGPTTRLIDERIETFVAGVTTAARTVTQQSGGEWPRLSP